MQRLVQWLQSLIINHYLFIVVGSAIVLETDNYILVKVAI